MLRGIAALLVIACGGDAAPTVSPIPLAGLAEAQMRLLCSRLTCPGNDLLGAFAAADFEGCVAFYLSVRSRLPIEDEIARGELSFDGTRLAQCFADFEVSCDDDALARCYRLAITGATPVGGACNDSAQCGPESACPVGEDLCGACEVAPRAGEPCLDGYLCGENAVCEPGLGGTCVAERTVVLALGDTCDSLDRPPTEATSYACPRGSMCRQSNRDVGVPSACVPLAAEGEACSQALRCASHLVCEGFEVGTCGRVEVVTTEGASCAEPDQRCSAFRRLECQDGRCVSLGDGGAGTPCSTSESLLGVCREGFTCRAGPGERGACEPLEAECTRDAHCAAGLRCVDQACRELSPPCAP